jgi:hypothetical protein
MDWYECLHTRLAKDVSSDLHLIRSLREIAAQKIEAANILPNEHYIREL